MEEGQQPDVCLYIHPIFVSLKAACSRCKEDSGEGDFLVCFCLLFGIMFVSARQVSIGWWGLLVWEAEWWRSRWRSSHVRGSLLLRVCWDLHDLGVHGVGPLASLPWQPCQKCTKTKMSPGWVLLLWQLGGVSEEEDLYVLFYFTNFH